MVFRGVLGSMSHASLEVVSAKGIYVYDAQGRAYMDLISGIAVSALGHGHAGIKAAFDRQWAGYGHVGVYGAYHLSPQRRLAEALVETLPSKKAWRVYLTNSGSEALEGALRVAISATQRPNLVACYNAYHGSTLGALSLSAHRGIKHTCLPHRPGISHIRHGAMEDLHRCMDHETAAVVMEPVQGEAGVRAAAPEYFQALSKRAKEVGAVVIADEIQSGWGRTGTFWAFQKLKFVPDILLTAKAMGGGLPMGAFIVAEQTAKTFEEKRTFGHLSTFGGHPLCCATALESWRITYKEGLYKQVPKQAEWWVKPLQKCPNIKEIRHAGLLMAIDLGHAERAHRAVLNAQKNGLLVDTFLYCDQALRLAPPLTMTEKEVQVAVEGLTDAIERAVRW